MTTNTELQSQNAAHSTVTATIGSSRKMSIDEFRKSIQTEQPNSFLEAARLTEKPAPLIVFSNQIEQSVIHYLDTSEKRGYIPCNGEGCVLCQVKDKPYVRNLLPVYHVLNRQVEVLAMSNAQNPHALMPQVMRVFDAVEPTLLMISRNYNKYSVDLRPIPQTISIDQSKIEAFNTAFDNGDIKLSSIYPTCTNEELAALPTIQTMLLLSSHTGA